MRRLGIGVVVALSLACARADVAKAQENINSARYIVGLCEDEEGSGILACMYWLQGAVNMGALWHGRLPEHKTYCIPSTTTPLDLRQAFVEHASKRLEQADTFAIIALHDALRSRWPCADTDH